MKTIFRLFCSAFIVLSLSAIYVLAQGKNIDNRTITGNYHDTATIEPTIARIKSLNCPPDFRLRSLRKSKIRECWRLRRTEQFTFHSARREL